MYQTSMAPGISGPSIPPYMGVERDQQIKIKVGRKVRRFRVATYRAYNAMGLIGSECNGVVVFDEDERKVLCDEIGRKPSAWCGVGDNANLLFDWMVSDDLDPVEFREFINTHKRTRYHI